MLADGRWPARVGRAAAARDARCGAQVAPLPPQYQRRLDLEAAHRTALLGTEGTVAITAATIGVSGSAGVGKSSMAVCLARDPAVQAHFSDGVTWLPFGRERTGAVKCCRSSRGDSAWRLRRPLPSNAKHPSSTG